MTARNKQNASKPLVAVEALETRRLLSAAPAVGTAELIAGELNVNGTKGADVILVSMNYSDPMATTVDVRVNDALVGNFALDQITGAVHVNAGKGDDSVRFDESTGLVPLRLFADGGQGDDTLVGGSLDDGLRGGNGDDVLYGNDGYDALFGGNGKDLLAGGFGDDELDGGNGKDTLYGETGADTLRGGNGKDLLDGGDDADNLDGGRGSDELTGGLAADLFASSDKSSEILDKADEDVYTPAKPGKGGGLDDGPETEGAKGSA